MSSDLTWMIVRNNSSFMVKGRLSRTKIFSKDPMSLTGVHSCTSGSVAQNRGVGLRAAPDNKGVVLSTKKVKKVAKPRDSLNEVTLKKGRRAVLTSVGNAVKSYDKAKKKAAMKRASAILRSQRPRIGKRSKKE